MGSTCSEGVEDKECIKKFSGEATWKTKNMSGNGSLKKRFKGKRWMELAQDHIQQQGIVWVWLPIISYSTETSILFVMKLR